MKTIDQIDTQTALVGEVLVCRDETGAVWTGTTAWMVRRDAEDVWDRTPSPEGVSSLLARAYDTPLIHAKYDHHDVIVTGSDRDRATAPGDHCYALLRPDGRNVYVSEGRLDAVYSVTSRDVVLRQAGPVLGAVGVFTLTEFGDEIVAVIMPVRVWGHQ